MNREQRRAWRKDQARRATARKRHPPRRKFTMSTITESTINAAGITFPILTDSGVYQEGEGYERLILVNHWDAEFPRRLAKFHIRVDRIPSRSFANTYVWSRPTSSWQLVAMWDHRDFWDSMPGYLRWSNDRSDEETARMLSNMVIDLLALIHEKEIEL
jgi:hypothetical protein